MSPTFKRKQVQHGSSLIEVLVTLIILMVGLLGLVGLMVQSQRSQMESLQRMQALVMLQDMVNRINTNRKNAVDYKTTSPLGTGMTCPTTEANTVERDLKEWCNALQGAGEEATISGVVSNVGAMLGARGCVSFLAADVYQVSVVWQGNGKTVAPTGVNCGADLYGDDAQRRAVSVPVQIAQLN